MVIVTERCFIIAHALQYMGIHEQLLEAEDDPRPLKAIKSARSGHKRVVKPSKCRHKVEYVIRIAYIPVQNPNSHNNNNGQDICNITVYDKDHAERLFKEIVYQYREQNPDELYLNKIAEKFLESLEKP